MNVAFFSTKSYDREYFDRYNTNTHRLTYYEAPLNETTVNLTSGMDFHAVCVFVNDHVTREVIEKLAENGVKAIALRCAGFNNVDLEAAQAYGIRVVRVPAYSPHAVAEHAVALILTLNRKIHKAYNRIRESNFSLERLTGFDLYKKTVGVIGTGSIGKVFAEIMLGFGCHMLAYDLYPSDVLKAKGVAYTELNNLIQESDIISLHCPLTPQTYHLINQETLQQIKRGAMLINTSRGGLVDTGAVIDALKHGQLGSLGLDVYEQEEHLFFKDLSGQIIQDDHISRLMTFPNVLITSHQGFLTEEALQQIALTTLQNLSAVEQKQPSPNEVIVSAKQVKV